MVKSLSLLRFRGDKLCVSGQETDERKRIFKNEKKN